MLNRNIPVTLFAVVILLLGVYFIWRAAFKQESTIVQPGEVVKTSPHQAVNAISQNIQTDTNPVAVQKAEPIAVKSKDTPVTWIAYTNKRLGFTFQHPAGWYQNGADADVINLSGAKTEVDINFTDTVSKTSLLIAYHLEPEGARLYEYVAEQYHSSQGRFAIGGTQLQVAGKNAFESVTTLTMDGKRHKLNPPLKLVLVDLPDYAQTGAIEFQFKTPAINEQKEINLFHQVLSGFKFIVK